MTAAGVYHAGDSWLYRLDPRVKLWYATIGLLTLVFTPNLPALIIVLALAHGVLLAGGVSLKQIIGLWQALIPVMLIILILQPLFSGGDGVRLWQIGPVVITVEGLTLGLRYVLRLATAAFVALAPIATTPIPTLVRGMEKLGMPHPLGMTIGLALHYLGTIGDLYRTISEAQQVRGWDLSQQGLIKRVQAAVPTLIALIIASLRLSDGLALGLAARGFGVNRARTYRRDIHMRKGDWLIGVAITMIFAIIVMISLQGLP